MSWRAFGATGSNNTPLGNSRRSGAGRERSQSPLLAVAESRRGRSPGQELNDDGTKKRRKRNRWGEPQEAAPPLTGTLPASVVASLTGDQLEAYTVYIRIEEIGQKLRNGDVVPPDGARSRSPAPIYDNQGRRINTREYRYRKALEDERHKLVEKAIKIIPNYNPPVDYKRPSKLQEKVYVPVNDYPEINFIGQLIGPRGNTLKTMELKSGAKIAIRGKGSVKEGKGRSDAAHTSNQEEDLHCLVMADTEEKIAKAKQLIHKVIETAASIPEGQNELKRNQLRELAALNGTLRDDENQPCQNCGESGHRRFECQERVNVTTSLICHFCQNAGHIARDCPDRQRGSDWRRPNRPGPGRVGGGDVVDREYESLMLELNGGGDGPRRQIEAGPGDDDSGRHDGRPEHGGDGSRPWQRGGGGGGSAAPWHQESRPERPRGGGAPPPWARQSFEPDQYGGGRGGYGHGPPPVHDSYHAGPVQPRGAPPPWVQGGLPPPPPPPPGGDGGHYGGYGQDFVYGGAPPPPPPDSMAPPPPPPDSLPPPPPPEDVPPPPPPAHGY